MKVRTRSIIRLASRSEERRAGEEWRYLRDWISDVCSSDLQHRLLVNEVAADHAVLRIFPVPDEGPDPVDHPLGLFGLPLPVRQDPQALQQLLFLLAGLLPPLLEASLAGARLEVLDVAEDHGHERGGAFAPTRLRDVDLADAAHAVLA